MDYPKSVANVGLVNGKFIDEDTAKGTVGSLIPAGWGNAVTDEILAVITAGGLTPDEATLNQLTAAIRNLANAASGLLIGIKTFTASGTYTATAETKSIIVEAVGGGGSGGACPATSSAQAAAGSGGGSGAYAKARFTTGFSGAAVTVGQGGAAPAAGSNNGNMGGTTSFGSLLSCPGGTYGYTGTVASSAGLSASNGGNGPVPTGANIVGFGGEAGANGVTLNGTFALAGKGGDNPLGIGGHYPTGGGARSGSGYGSGSSGVNANYSSAASAGLAGQPGIVIVYEYA